MHPPAYERGYRLDRAVMFFEGLEWGSLLLKAMVPASAESAVRLGSLPGWWLKPCPAVSSAIALLNKSSATGMNRHCAVHAWYVHSGAKRVLERAEAAAGYQLTSAIKENLKSLLIGSRPSLVDMVKLIEAMRESSRTNP